MVLCLGLQIGPTEARVFKGFGVASKVVGDHIRVIGINALAGEGAVALGGIGGDILNGDRLGGDTSKEEDEEEDKCLEKAGHDVCKLQL